MRNVQRESMGATRSKQKEDVADPVQKPYKGTVGVSDYGVILFTIGLHTIDPTTAARYKGTRDAVNLRTILDRCRRTSRYTDIIQMTVDAQSGRCQVLGTSMR